jgi:hypothetical protein
MSLNIKIEFNDAMIAELMRIPDLLRLGPAERCLADMGKVVAQRAKQLAPSSRQTGSRKKWSNKLKNDSRWSGVDSGQHMGVKTVKHNRGARIYIGARYPQGNKQQFDASPKGRRVFYWGKDSGRIKKRPDPHFLEQAYTETQSAQLAAFNKRLEIEIKELRIG